MLVEESCVQFLVVFIHVHVHLKRFFKKKQHNIQFCISTWGFLIKLPNTNSNKTEKMFGNKRKVETFLLPICQVVQ